MPRSHEQAIIPLVRRMSRCWLTVGQAVGRGGAGRADIHQRGNPFQLVVAGFVEEIADADHAARLQRKVRRQ